MQDVRVITALPVLQPLDRAIPEIEFLQPDLEDSGGAGRGSPGRPGGDDGEGGGPPVSHRCSAVLALLVLLLAGCAGTASDAATDRSTSSSASASVSSTAPTSSRERLIEVQAGLDGNVIGDTGRVPVDLGDTVMLVVETFAPDEVHVHGYELISPVSPYAPAEMTFTATLPGLFEVELHEAGTALLTLQVQ